MLFKVPDRSASRNRKHGKRHVGPNAFLVDFDNLPVHPGFRGVVENPFPGIAQVVEMEVLGEDARILEASPPFEGNVLHKGGSVQHTDYDLAFWFDRPYHSVSFEIRVLLAGWFYESFVFDKKGEPHVGELFDRVDDKKEHIITLNADTLQGNPETFQGFTLSVFSADHRDLDFDFDSLIAI
jgi:hypothetical protein